MAVDGTWQLTINTPMGVQESTLVIAADGAKLTGTQNAGQGEGKPIEDGSVNGNEIRWNSAITKPMPMTLVFKGTVTGDTLSGSVKLGMFGTSSFTGTRA